MFVARLHDYDGERFILLVSAGIDGFDGFHIDRHITLIFPQFQPVAHTSLPFTNRYPPTRLWSLPLRGGTVGHNPALATRCIYTRSTQNHYIKIASPVAMWRNTVGDPKTAKFLVGKTPWSPFSYWFNNSVTLC